MGEGKNLVGVDIGSSSIKVCQVKDARRGTSLVKFAYASLPPQTIVDGQVMDSRTVVSTLQKLFSEHKIRSKDVCLSVSGQNVIIRKITVPKMTSEELSEQIAWEAEQHIPFDIKDVHVDYQVLRTKPDSSQMDLLLVAAKKDHISAYAQLAKDAKLRPIVVDIDAFSLQNLFESARGVNDQQVVALINVGASLSSLNIVANKISSFTREIANGGNSINDELQRQLGVSFEQAEAYKCGLSPDGVPIPEDVTKIVNQGVDTIAAEIQRSLDFYMATSGDVEIARIYLTGGTASLPTLTDAIHKRAQIPTETWDPVAHLTVDKKVDGKMLAQHAPQLAIALGLTLRKTKEARV